MTIFIINALTLTRILISVVIFGFLAFEIFYIPALVLFFLAGTTDYLDGFLARKFNATSALGEVLDPVADKILIIFCLFGLALNLSSYLIGFIGAFIITREIWVSALRDLNSRSNNIEATKVTFLAKIKTTVQLGTIMTYLIALAFDFMLLIIIGDIFLIISLLITIYTGLQYTQKTFKF